MEDSAEMNQINPSPVADFKDGFNLEQSEQFRNNRELSQWLSGGDASVWFNLRPTEAMPATAVVPNRCPPSPLPKTSCLKLVKS